MPAHDPVMMSPIGKIPSVVPGSTNTVAALTISGSRALASGTVMLVGVLSDFEKNPAT